jgi:quercetin dioxygenase-like cupin family protein
MQPVSTTQILHSIVEETHDMVLVLPDGATMEFLTSPDDDRDFCVIKGTIPSGGFVPLHSHPDIETFLVLSGTLEALTETDIGLGWKEVHAGDYLHVESDARHAWRNPGEEPGIALVITTRRLGRLFLEMGRPINGAPEPPTADDVARLAALADEYGHWLASPEENAAVGIELSALA